MRPIAPSLKRWQAVGLLSLLIVLCFSLLGMPAGWGDLTSYTLNTQPPARLRAIMPMVQWRKKGFLNHLYTFDRRALETRTPLILIPGRAEEFQRSSWWKKFRAMTDDNPAFERQFKLYIFIYNSREELDVQARDLNRELKAYFSDFTPKHRQVVLVSHSLGGMIAREAFADPATAKLTHTVYALAVPFHGSPMFDPKWFSTYLRPPNHSPIRKFWDQAIYNLYMFDKNNLKRGLRWNNFDGSKPLYGKPNLQGDVLTPSGKQHRVHPAAAKLKPKTVIYASYLKNQYTHPDTFRRKRGPLMVPRTIVSSILPFYGVSVHSVFTYMNLQLANLPTFSPEQPFGDSSTHLYRYNDGVIPIGSMLYLPKRERPYHEPLPQLIQRLDVRSARVFENIDHMHIGEYTFFKKRIRVADVLHPEDGQRTPNEWLIHDLMTLSKTISTIPKQRP